jgi:UDP-N-acetylmuramate dehydrogenase
MMHNATPMEPHLERDVPLAPFTTLGIGGPAKFSTRTATVDQIREALDWAHAHGEPVFLLAGGSNVLIADRGFEGLVVKIDLRGITVIDEDPGSVHVKVAAGEPWDDFVAHAVARRWAGVECLSGIPGTTGATPIQNVGAYGQEVSETIVRVETLDRTTGRVVWFTNEECRFGYRSSLFKNRERERYVVLSVTFRLQPNGEAALRYPELRQYVDDRGIDSRDLAGVREAVLAIRRRKGMVLDPTDPDTRSDGSFFVNPIIPIDRLPAFLGRAGSNVPHFPSGDEVKLSAAWLIEHAGFHKGFVHGNVGLSSKHALAIINRGSGTAAEVVELVTMIQERVKEAFGIEIHPEPNFVGFPVYPERSEGSGRCVR